MFYRYLVHSIPDTWTEVPWEKREWWFLASKHGTKEHALSWHKQHKRSYYRYKLVTSDRNLKDSFYPREEIKKRTQTAQLLKSINYGE